MQNYRLPSQFFISTIPFNLILPIVWYSTIYKITLQIENRTLCLYGQTYQRNYISPVALLQTAKSSHTSFLYLRSPASLSCVRACVFFLSWSTSSIRRTRSLLAPSNSKPIFSSRSRSDSISARCCFPSCVCLGDYTETRYRLHSSEDIQYINHGT